MAKRGRKPKPDALLRLTGSREMTASGKRRERSGRETKSDPGPVGEPVRPRNLSRRARDLWAQYVPRLVRLGVVGENDAIQLARLCEIDARIEELWRFQRKNGSSYDHVDARGNVNPRMRPETKELHELMRTSLRIACEFGMTPSSRVNARPDNQVTAPAAKPDAKPSPFPKISTA